MELRSAADDFVMELRSAGMFYDGIQGAREFYDMFIPSFEDMPWIPQALVLNGAATLSAAEIIV